MSTAFNPAKTSPASWDAFADVDAFVDAVLAELMAGTRPTRSGPKPPLTGAALRKAILAIWCVAFCGLQHRPALRHPVWHALLPVRPRLGLWRRLLNRLILAWRQAWRATETVGQLGLRQRMGRTGHRWRAWPDTRG
jgi:hypothetical protein